MFLEKFDKFYIPVIYQVWPTIGVDLIGTLSETSFPSGQRQLHCQTKQQGQLPAQFLFLPSPKWSRTGLTL